MAEVTDLRDLRRGDHCMCPLNLMRGVSQVVDTVIDSLADFELLRFHHHFVVLDDVDHVEDGTSRRADGPCCPPGLCDFSIYLI